MIPSRLLALFLTAAIVPAATVAACGGRSVDFRALGSADGGPGDSDSDKALDAPSDASAGDGACLEAPEEPPGAHGSLDVSFADGGALTFPQNGNEVMDQMCVFGLPGDGAIVIGRSVTEGIGVIYVGGYRVAATGAITASWSVPYQDLVACGQAPDGTVFIAGRSTAAAPTTMMHFDAAGSPDTAFGTASLPFTPVAIAVSGSGNAVALSDGSDLQTVRFGADGGLAATTTLRPATSGKAIARGPSGQLFVAGVPTEPAVASPVVARLDGDRVDLSWGSDGWATLPVMVAEQTSLLIAADERGRLVAAVRSSPGFAVGRLTSKGQPDPSFGHQGVADGYGGDGLAVQANGKIVLAADVYPSGALFRLNADGDYDTGFKPPPIYLAFPRAAPDMSLTVLGGGEIIARTRHNVLVRLHP